MLLFLFVGVIIDGGMRRIGSDLEELSRLDEPASAAAYEMEINANSTGLGVLRYLETGDPRARERAYGDEWDFELFEARYEEAVQTPEARRAGEKVGALYEKFSSLGEGLMYQKDREDALLNEIDANFEEIDRLLEKMDPADTRKVRLAAEMEGEAAGVGTWLGIYLREHREEDRQHIFEEAEDFRAGLEGFRSLRLRPEEERRADALDEQFEETMELIEEALSIEDSIREDLARFGELRNEIDAVLDEEMQILARNELMATQRDAVVAVRRLRGTLFTLLLAGSAAGLGAAYFVGGSIVRPLERLTEGARRIGQGDLAHRIEAGSEGEVGELTAAFNQMAEKRQCSEEEKLKESRNSLAVAQRIAHLGSFEYAVDGDEARWSEELFHIFGLSSQSAEPTYKEFMRYVHPEDKKLLRRKVREALYGEERGYAEYRVVRPDGEVRDVYTRYEVIRDEAGRPRELVGTVQDVTRHKRAEREIHEWARYSRNLFEVNLDALFTVDTGGHVQDANPSMSAMTGVPREELIGRSVFEFLMDADLDREKFEETLICGYAQDYSATIRHADGRDVPVVLNATVYRDEDDRTAGILASARDMTEHNRLMYELEHTALHDSLTSLPNRTLFFDRLEHALSRARREGRSVAVLLVDLDRFKMINDSLGHMAGDELLRESTRRLRGCLCSGDTLARIGGDEFAVLLEDVADAGDAALIAGRVSAAFEKPFEAGGREVAVEASIGIALGDGTGSAEALLRNADLAMYSAKRNCSFRYEVFDPEMNARAGARLELENGLRRAIERGEIRIHYQPEVDLQKDRLYGFEALVRWESPEKRIVYPAEFIPLAEETGLIIPLGRYVLREACRQARSWQDRYPQEKPLVVAVNVSASQLRLTDVVEEVEAALKSSRLPARNLCLEITESVLMEDAEPNLTALIRLKALGVRLAIDDFGTGYSSLSYLKRFPVDVIKIDRSFVSRMELDSESVAIVESITTLSRTLGLEVVAEGVESAEQAELLRNLGCELAQGFLYSRPLDLPATNELLAGVFLRGRSLVPSE